MGNKIAICIPNNRPNLDEQFVKSLLGVVQSFYVWNDTLKEKHHLTIYFKGQGWIDRMRENLAYGALEDGMDFILWLDADMTFSPSIIQQMMRIFEGYENVDAVTGLYTWKIPPFQPHVYTEFAEGKFTPAVGFPVDKSFEVESAGFGCLMMKTSLIRKLERPWFKFIYGKCGEDMFFFKKLKEQKIPYVMLCNPRISCGHLTTIQVDIQSYIAYNNIKVKEGNLVLDDQTLKKLTEHQQRINEDHEKSLSDLTE